MLKYLTLLLTLIAFPAFGPAFGQTLGGGTVGIPGLTTNAVEERHLKAVNEPTDEFCATYEEDILGFEWQACGTPGALTAVVQDTTPQLGGDLDVNGKEITGAIDLHSTGDVILELGDNVGVNKVIINDSDGAEVAAIDSNGVITAVDLTVDSDVLHVDAADNFIGIGTATSNTDNQVLFRMSGTKDILIDGTTNNRNIDTGTMRFEQTPAIENTRAITLNINANSQPNTHAVVINVLATGIGLGELISAYDVNIDKNTSTGGVARAFEVSQTGAGSIDVVGLHSDPGVAPLTQNSGTFGAIEQAFTYDSSFTDVTAAFNAAGAGASLFVGDGDFVYIGDAATFNGISIVLDTFATNPGVKTVFTYSNGSGGFLPFTPSDETQGFRQDGLISWTVSNLAGWAPDTVNAVGSKYWIRFARNTAAAITVPIEDIIQIASSNVYGWDRDGVIDAANINLDITSAATGAVSDWDIVVTNAVVAVGLDIGVESKPSTPPSNSGYYHGLYSQASPHSTASDPIRSLVGIEGGAVGRSGVVATELVGVRAMVWQYDGSTATNTYAFSGIQTDVTNVTNSYGLWLGDFSSVASTINEAIHVSGGDINLAASGQYLAPSGTVGAPSYADTGDRDSGLYFPAENEVGLVAGGVEGIHQTTTEVQPLLPINMQDGIISRAIFKDTAETVNVIGNTGGGAQDIDLELGNVVTATQTVGQTTYAFTNPASGGTSFSLILTDGGSNGGSIFPGSVTWVTNGGVTPTLQTSGTDILSFFTVDGGTSWLGYGPVTGTRSLWIPADEWVPAVTNGAAALASTETTALRPDIKHMGFASGADDFAQTSVAFPTAWDNGTITFKVYWAHVGASTFTIDWALQCVTITDDETLDVAYGTAIVVEDTGGTTEDLYITAESGDVTCGGTPADGELTEFQIYRDVSGDDLDVDADMIGVKIFYTVDANT